MIYGIIGIWVLCGLLAYGQTMAWYKDEIEPVLGIEGGAISDSVFAFILGPIGIFSAVYVHYATSGKLWYKLCFQFRTSPPTDPRFRKE